MSVSPSSAPATVPARPGGAARNPVQLAIIANAHAPYRAHLHRRIVREVPEVRLWSLYTHELSNAPWAFEVPPEINPVSFGSGESAEGQSRFAGAVHEWRKAGRIIRWLRERRIDVVLVNGYNDVGRVRIINWCHAHGVPVMLWGDSNIRGDHPRGLRHAAKRWLVPRVLRRCTAVLPCGSLGRAYFAKYGVPDGRMFYFPVEPDYDLIQNPPHHAVADAARRFALGGTRRRVMFSGRLAAVKRPDLLIDAFVAVADQRPDWDLLMVGDGPLRAELERRVPAPLAHRVTWTGFLSSAEEMAALYRLSHVLVLPSDYEPWALVVNEAAAAGLAIISTDVVGASAELVRDGENGWLFQPGNLAQLRDALLRVTAGDTAATLGAASLQVLRRWRRDGDPVLGLRRALAHVLPGWPGAGPAASPSVEGP